MSSLLGRALAAWRMELRLVVRHWSYPLLLLAWSALVVYLFKDQALISPEAALTTSLRTFSVGLVSLAALILGAVVAGRSQRTRFAALEETFPTGAEVLLGRWLACSVALLPTQVAAVALASRVGPAASFWRGLPTFLLEAGVTFAFTVAVGWLFVTWFGPRRWVYPVLAGGWIGSLGPTVFFGGRGLGIPGIELLDFVLVDTTRYEELWGRLMEGTRPVWFNLFYAGLAALVVALVVARAAARRKRRAPLIPATLALAALMLAASAATAYVRHARAWEAQAITIESIRPPDAGATGASPATVIDTWEIAADLSDPATPRFDARFTLRHAGSEPISTATLTLHRDLEITMSSVPYERDGDVLTLTLPEPLAPGATRDLRLSYGGRLLTLITAFHATPDPLVFTGESGVRLPLFAGWYPVPGQALVAPDATDEIHLPGRFILNVSLPHGWGVFTNLPATGETTFASDRATWAVLYASPRLRTERVGTSTIIAPEALLPEARAVVPDYEAVLAEYAPFFPAPAPDGVTLAILDDFPGLAYHTPPAGPQPLVVLGQNAPWEIEQYAFNRRYHVGDGLAADLWTLAGGDPQLRSPHHSVRGFLWSRYVAGDDLERFRHELADMSGGMIDEGAMGLYTVYAERGVDGVRKVIARMIAEQETLRSMEPDELATWIEEVARAR